MRVFSITLTQKRVRHSHLPSTLELVCDVPSLLHAHTNKTQKMQVQVLTNTYRRHTQTPAIMEIPQWDYLLSAAVSHDLVAVKETGLRNRKRCVDPENKSDLLLNHGPLPLTGVRAPPCPPRPSIKGLPFMLHQHRNRCTPHLQSLDDKISCKRWQQ